MSGHGANPVFFNKKIKIGRPDLHTVNPKFTVTIAFYQYLKYKYCVQFTSFISL